MQFKDQLGNTISLNSTPKRIVSLVPSQTELLVDLGLKEQLVGITKFCVHPKNLRKEIKVVGGTKSLHYDRVEALNPDVIICNKEENTKDMVTKLQNIAPVWVSDIFSIEDSLEMIRSLGAMCNAGVQASKMVMKINSEKNSFEQFMQSKPSKKVAYVIWKKPFMLAGKATFINELLALNNYENVCQNASSRYPKVEKDFLKQADEVLLSTEPFPFKEKHAVKLREELGTKVNVVDGEYFSWYGSRLAEAFSYFKTLHK
ncbi:ABC transporter substrate-binding protein [Marixanthomonas spongiae]|uniref:Cobalamin-binding protein n=1 Tax=Marixanthomonas spongiae TaxID=2174845 RepID=A0A2U0I089_9FLAO|nr:helical backbone metal receptor [Marixanthomonas spongiae]PVW14521.1 cobalamin-binding protein [Marixanthomonas spongiae]